MTGLKLMKTTITNADQTAKELPLLDQLMACLEVKHQAHHFILIDSDMSNQFSDVCPVCNQDAIKAKHKDGSTVYLHSAFISKGVALRADYCPAKPSREDYR